MAMRISPITAQLGRLSIGGAAPSPLPSSSSCSRSGATRLVHTVKRKKGERVEPSFEPGHGEKIFIFNHFRDGMTVYSHDPVIKPTRALAQIPFNGKKSKPAKIRKDYWRPLAMIQFPEGQGEVGRSVYQRLRECKKLHEYCWGDELLYDEDGRTLTARQRGRRLNNQRANTIADMAAVLAGLGKGNKIVIDAPATATTTIATPPPAPTPTPTSATTPSATPASASAEGEADKKTEGEPAGEATAEEKPVVEQTPPPPPPPPPVILADGKALVQATVFWSDANDKHYATSWSSNVTHALFQNATLVPKEGVAVVEEAVAEQAAAPEVVENTTTTTTTTTATTTTPPPPPPSTSAPTQPPNAP